MEFVQWLIVVFGVYEVITVPLYVRILWVLLSDKLFQSPFYRLITLLGILELVHSLVDIVFYRLSFFAAFIRLYLSLAAGWWISFVSFIIYSFTYQQFMLHTVISLNRLSGIFAPFKQKTIWSSSWRWLAILIALIATLMGSDRLLCAGKFVPLVANDTGKGVIPAASVYWFYQANELDQSLNTVTLGAICAALCLLFNLCSLAKVWRMKHSGQLATFKSSHQLELNFLLVAVFMMVPQVALVIFHGIWRMILNRQMLSQFLVVDSLSLYRMMSQIPWLDDLFSLSQPWILMFVCGELRATVLRPILGQKSTTKTMVISLKTKTDVTRGITA